jgi:5'-3' exonuclease
MFNDNDAVYTMFNKSCMDSEREFDKCFIDADSIIFKIAVTSDSITQAKSAFDKALDTIMRDTQSTKGYVAVKGIGNFRYQIAEDYKGNRKNAKPMEPKVIEIRQKLTEYAWETGCFKSDDCEADDIVSIWAQEAFDAGESYVIAHIDKDIDMVPGWHYGFNKKVTYFIDGDTGHYKMCIQMLTGDSTDHIMGIKGIGPKKAEKILLNVPTSDMLRVVGETWRDHHPRDWEDKLEVCWNLLYMRRDWNGFRRLTLEEIFGDE